MSRGPTTPSRVRKRAVLYANGDILVNEWPILVPFYPFHKLGSHIYLCASDGIHGKIEKRMRGNKEGHTSIYLPSCLSSDDHVTLRRLKKVCQVAVSCMYSRLIG